MAIKKEVTEEAPDPKWLVGSFEPTAGVKEVLIDPSSSEDKVVRIGTTLPSKYESTLDDFLRANRDIFAWKPSDMPVIPREVAEHALKIRPGSKPVKQRLRRFDEEIAKILAAGFIKEVYHLEWLANPVLVQKKEWEMDNVC